MKKRKNPMTFSYANLRKWIFLYFDKFKIIPKYAEPTINTIYATDSVITFFKLPRTIVSHAAIETILIDFREAWSKIFNSKLTVFQKSAMWRKIMLDEYPPFNELMVFKNNQIRSWWVEYEPSLDEIW